MFKIIVSYESRANNITDRRFLLKTVPEGEGSKKELLEAVPMFENEIRMYTETLPAMDKILSQCGEKCWWPRLVYCDKESKILIFDDLTQQNYKMAYKPLNYYSVIPVAEKLAKFHALSMRLAETDQQDVVTQFTASFNRKGLEPMCKAFTRTLGSLAEVVKTWSGCELIGAKIEHVADKLFENFLTCVNTKSPWINVLNHGDFHYRNLMFRKEDSIFLDFQLPVYHSPGYDLVYLLCVMGDPEVRDNRDELVKLYSSYLAANLKVYGYSGKVPSVVDIRIELLRMTGLSRFIVIKSHNH